MNMVDIGILLQGPKCQARREKDSRQSTAAFRGRHEFNFLDRTTQRVWTKNAGSKAIGEARQRFACKRPLIPSSLYGRQMANSDATQTQRQIRPERVPRWLCLSQWSGRSKLSHEELSPIESLVGLTSLRHLFRETTVDDRRYPFGGESCLGEPDYAVRRLEIPQNERKAEHKPHESQVIYVARYHSVQKDIDQEQEHRDYQRIPTQKRGTHLHQDLPKRTECQREKREGRDESHLGSQLENKVVRIVVGKRVR